MKIEIIKVQLPIVMSEGEDPMALIYDKKHVHECTQPVTGMVLRVMKGKLKKFFHAEWMPETERWRVIDEAPYQEW